ncbi:MAG: MerC domain-containing protein [Pseudomonadota bacterium]
MKANAPTLDAAAVGLSFMCLIHCLALPVISAFLPLASVLAEAEWVHQFLVLIALPITALAIARHRKSRVRFSFIIPAVIGLVLLLAAGFVESLHDSETQLTMIGAMLLALAHAWRWAHRSA